jgi:monoamine oxidase
VSQAPIPLMAFLQGLARDYSAADATGMSVEEVQQARRREIAITRREALKAGGGLALGAAIAGPALLGRPARADAASPAPTIAIIGAGIAGLNCALQLQTGTKKVPGFGSTIYEAGSFVGGRMHSDTTTWENGQVSEHCGELIDTNHTTILDLVSQFGLSTTNLLGAQPAGSTDTYYVNGGYYSVSQATSDFAPVYKILKQQNSETGGDVLYNSYNSYGEEYDNMNIYTWIENYVPGGHSSNFGQLLDVAYNAEDGLDTSQQSAIDLIELIYPKPPQSYAGSKDVQLYGYSNEKYHITGGNQLLPEAIASYITSRSRATPCTINLNTAMTEISLNSNGTYALTFQQGSSQFQETYDVVVIAIPFSVLRTLNFSNAGFDSFQTNIINNLGYGTNSKLQCQFTSRLWNTDGPWGISTGSTYTSLAYQTSWDVTRGQSGTTGILVDYTGGTAGASFTNPADLQTYAQNFVNNLNTLYPGISSLYNGIATLDTPWNNPYLLGSYSTALVGQYTTMIGGVGLPQGNCYFSGEHCSVNYQGFMEGGAESGATTAQAIQNAYQQGTLGASRRMTIAR